MSCSTAIVIFISLALSAFVHGHDTGDDTATALMDKISENVDIGALNATALEQVENLKNQMKNKCDKNAGPGQYDKLLRANDDLQNCVKGLVNVTELQDEIEKAKPTGDLDLVFKKYCLKKTTLKKCMTNFTSILNPCLESQERDNTKIIQNVTDSLLNFICHKEGDRIALFIAAGGPECFQSKQQEIQDCLNATYGSYLPAGADSLPTLETLPKLMFGVKECSDMEKLQECIVKKLDTCSDPTPGNVADALFNFVKRVTPCESMLKIQHAALIEEKQNTNEATIISIHSFILLVTTMTLAYF